MRDMDIPEALQWARRVQRYRQPTPAEIAGHKLGEAVAGAVQLVASTIVAMRADSERAGQLIVQVFTQLGGDLARLEAEQLQAEQQVMEAKMERRRHEFAVRLSRSPGA